MILSNLMALKGFYTPYNACTAYASGILWQGISQILRSLINCWVQRPGWYGDAA